MGGNSYAAMQALAAQMGSSSNETHTVSPLDELMALKTLKDMCVKDSTDAALWQGYIDDATRLMKVAAHTIMTQPAVSDKLGVQGLPGVLALTSIMKQSHADEIFNQVIKDSLKEGEKFGLESPADRLGRMNLSRVRKDPTTGLPILGVLK
jgi:hypothetical protein